MWWKRGPSNRFTETNDRWYDRGGWLRIARPRKVREPCEIFVYTAARISKV